MRWTEEQYAAFLKASKTKPSKPKVIVGGGYQSNVRGWRTIGGKRHWFRSLWEIQYCTYLEFLKQRGEVLDWLYESKTFEFPKDAYRVGPFYYKPDFKVIDCDGSHRWIEVKGHMNASSKKKIARFNKHHGATEGLMEVVGPEWFKSARQQGLNKIIPGWESLPK